ncbi:pyridoxamine 5'-phosphate oxidase family protein [Sphaerotilus sp.]|uniref:pyridoxamine 5'-phosphate oxidase family protein n=1 Tax=Sphaerotilus sp. TaxID=2093942 RepID=UPI002ACD7374|nr:pyridoxamine 5'-phosphate oxidase family protein [Sphaerotilus sp.]MDZ7857067.1 pyridoxamine 5'-phosphate oxidase family protein [Sphaerotilus sp.]
MENDGAGLDTGLSSRHAALWAELARAATVRGHPWRQVTLATTCPQLGPQARTVVIREVDLDARELLIYTDTRSPKVAQLDQDPRAQIVCWSAALGWQLRLRCVVGCETEGLDVTSRWATLRHTRAAQDYLSPLAPGSVLGSDGVMAAAAPPGERRGAFAVLRARVLEMDWLSLDPAGHQRAVFDCRDATGAGRWLVP